MIQRNSLSEDDYIYIYVCVCLCVCDLTTNTLQDLILLIALKRVSTKIFVKLKYVSYKSSTDDHRIRIDIFIVVNCKTITVIIKHIFNRLIRTNNILHRLKKHQLRIKKNRIKKLNKIKNTFSNKDYIWHRNLLSEWMIVDTFIFFGIYSHEGYV